jgi:outer membrane receptor for ferrienterochelin and colicins
MLNAVWRDTLLLLFGCAVTLSAEPAVSVVVEVRFESTPVADARVTIQGQASRTAADGTVSIVVTPGEIAIAVDKDGFVPITTTVHVAAGEARRVLVELQRPPAHEETITVSVTRTGRRLDDQPTRVEVLEREEIEEKMLMTPGDIVMMLNEMGGMRVQSTAPSLGAASIRVQGMRGRYTRVFSDGLPLFGEVGGLGLLQIPPMDLAHVEVIKGVASSLYGAGAMGGIVNLVSRRPGARAERELLVNRSTRGATDLVGWYATPARTGWAFTMLGGGHWQERTDVDGDRWSDLPGYSRLVIRPRAFWDDGSGRTFFATAGVTAESRDGGGVVGGLPYPEALDTRRVDAGAVGQVLFAGRHLLTARAAVVQQRHNHRFGEGRERDRHDTLFTELTVRTQAGRHTLVGGLALERDAYRPRDLPRFADTFTVPGIFVQDDVDVARWLAVSASARVDRHSEYGTFFSPRVSALFRAGAWTSRVSAGGGFFAPTPLTEETEAAGLTRLLIPRRLRAEEGRSVSLDISRTHGQLSYTVTVFGSRVRYPIDVDRSAGLVLTNGDEPATNAGVELLGTLRREPFAVTASYAYVSSRELDEGRRRQTPLTPKHSAGIVGMWEREDEGRVGVELYYTGSQRLEENPFRAASRPYVILGVLAERPFGPVRVFVNGENLTNVRQTRWDRFVRPDRAPDGRWTVDAWAPLDGRTVNAGVRLQF